MEIKSEINVVYVPYLPSQRQLKMKIQLKKEAKVSELKQEIENNSTSLSPSISNKHSVGFSIIKYPRHLSNFLYSCLS